MVTEQDPDSLADEDAKDTTRKPHPIARAVNTAVRSARDIDECDAEFVNAADQHKHHALEGVIAELKQLRDEARAALPDTLPGGARVQRLFDVIRRSDRIAGTRRGATLRTSLLLGLFSAFDAFIGDLVSALFERKPELFKKLNGQVPISEVLEARSIDDLRREILADEVESLRRKSYVDQFDALEKLFDVTLTAFNRWPAFVELSQRRNLYAHCNGLISDQYVAICRKYDAPMPPDARVGKRLPLDRAYMENATRLIAEIALKLGQTLWRKTLPSELGLADQHLNRVALEALQFGEWSWASIIGEFALGQKKWSEEQARRIAVVNQAIALKFGGSNQAAVTLLDSFDWSASLPEFKLANAVLREQFDLAAEVMLRIGDNGELVEQSAYLDWPLFRDFRGTRQFAAAYESIYGEPFVVAVDSSLDAAERRAEQADQLPDTAA
ncbi:MAG TPA: hypothetical protein VGF48_26465 [Thermoanaerobaculia bacterium]|jgi:hypothetical protein